MRLAARVPGGSNPNHQRRHAPSPGATPWRGLTSLGFFCHATPTSPLAGILWVGIISHIGRLQEECHLLESSIDSQPFGGNSACQFSQYPLRVELVTRA